jgi:hypothetical protein
MSGKIGKVIYQSKIDDAQRSKTIFENEGSMVTIKREQNPLFVNSYFITAVPGSPPCSTTI